MFFPASLSLMVCPALPFAVSLQVRHDIAWFDKDESAVGVLTARLESEASAVSKGHDERRPTLSHLLAFRS